MNRLERIIGPMPAEKEARVFGLCGIAIALIACVLSLYYGFKGETFLGRPLGGDFVQFYAAGRILNQHEPSRLFDITYLADMEHASLPTMPGTQMLIFGNAPFIAAIFRPLALLTYQQAYCVWLVLSAAIYLISLLFLLQGNRTGLILALSTPMFTLETWIGGQVSVFAFLAFALCTRWFTEKRYFLAGIALGLAAYKPSLIAIPAAMFLAGRCWRLLAGLALSVALIFGASFATVGFDGMALWLRTLRVFRYLATDQASILRRSKYVDLNSFLTGLFGPNQVATIAGYLLVAVALILLAWAWFRSGKTTETMPELWASTIAATLILNIYVPVYDTIVLIPALFLMRRRKGFEVWMLLFCLVPWLTQSAAEFLRLQLLTTVIAAFSYWTLKRPDSAHPERSLQ